MKRLLVLFVILVILGAGGGLTAALISSGGTPDFLPFLEQVASPEGSVLAATGQQAQLLVILIGFVLFNVIGMAVTLAVVFWLLHRGVKSVEAEAKAAAPARKPVAGVAEPGKQVAAES